MVDGMVGTWDEKVVDGSVALWDVVRVDPWAVDLASRSAERKVDESVAMRVVM